jgi:hypothetical protein
LVIKLYGAPEFEFQTNPGDRDVLLLKTVGESVATLLHLALLGLLAGSFVDRWSEGAAALEKECSAKEKQQGYFHEAKNSVLRSACQGVGQRPLFVSSLQMLFRDLRHR